MSSRVFKARTSHSVKRPQLCGLDDSPIVGQDKLPRDRKHEADDMFYLTCQGDAPEVGRQIEKSTKEDDFSTGYRTVPTGRTRVVAEGTRWERNIPIYKWQQRFDEACVSAGCRARESGEHWHDVTVWERLVKVTSAERLGYRVPGGRTTAMKGARTEGRLHRVDENPESPLEALARVALTPEEGGDFVESPGEGA